MMTVRTLVVDDEPLAREGIRLRLAREAGFEVVGECANGLEAVEAIHDHAPDVVFLDVQMPGLNGFEVLEEIDPRQAPVVVFVTAYDEYALRAFEAHALDYVLKPFDDDRFAATLRRVRERVAERHAGRVGERLSGLMAELGLGSGARGGAVAGDEDAGEARCYAERLVVRDGARIAFVPVAELDRVEADGDYVRLFCGARQHLIRRTMAQMEARLDPARFVRIHRSAIVAVDRIRELRPSFRGEYAVLLHDGTRLNLSRGYRRRLQHLIDEAL
ncbi:MAG TPA: LytTR family DNA-binding domain-containing protein [Longimicrobium sp.]|jgi:two-component system LytT family response regulator|uniref:LytR/AlgR family response regulator transcription factor n=1 Tax=Longimicrobium sp. TaxID=2029185 RepID=UPI002EDB9B3C